MPGVEVRPVRFCTRALPESRRRFGMRTIESSAILITEFYRNLLARYVSPEQRCWPQSAIRPKPEWQAVEIRYGRGSGASEPGNTRKKKSNLGGNLAR